MSPISPRLRTQRLHMYPAKFIAIPTVMRRWTHVLVWDLFVGRWIWLDGQRRDIFTSHSVLLTNLIGPPGLLLHLLTCLVVGKGLPDEVASDSRRF